MRESTIEAPWRERRREMLSYGLLFLLLIPNLAWILLDRGLWSSDTAYYGLHALRLNHSWDGGFGNWWTTMLSVEPKPPILPWVAQFLVPIGRAIGHVDAGLLGATIAAQGLALVLLYRTFAELTRDRAIAVVGCLAVAASPYFTGMAKQFYVQPVQLATTSWFVYIMVGSRRWDTLRTVLHLTAASSLALLASMSSPALCVLPGLVALFYATVRIRLGVRFGWSHVPLATLAIGLAATTLAWYDTNSAKALEYARYSYGDVYAGSLVEGYRDRFGNWLNFGFAGLMPVAVPALAVLAAGIAFTFGRQTRTHERFTLLALVCLLQICLALGVISLSVNQERRYVLPLAPFVAFILVWVLSRIGRRWATVGVALVLAYEFSGSQLADFGVGAVRGDRYGRALQTKGSRNSDVMRFVAGLIRNDVGPHVLGTHQLEFHNLMLSFEAAKDREYDPASNVHIDQIEFILTRPAVEGDADKAWTFILDMQPTYVVVANRELQQRKIEESAGGWRVVLDGTLAVSRQVARSDRYERVPTPEYPEIEVYRRANR